MPKSIIPGLPDDAFIHDGLITKRIVRAAALSFLRPAADELLWDIGAGAASICIEWARACPDARAIGIERREDRLANARTNIGSFDVQDQVELVSGDIADVISGLPDPDAIFIGGGLTSGVLDTCRTRLKPGGRLVVTGVTLEAETKLAAAHQTWGGELTRIAVEQVDQIGSFRGWAPLRTVTMWAYEA